MYHISDLKKFNRCPRIFLLDQISEKLPFQNFIRLDDEVTALAAKKIGAENYFVGERGDDPERAMKALLNYEWLMKARFEYGGLRIKVPFLHRKDNGFDLYFLFVGLFPRSDDMQFYRDTVWVLNSLGIPLNDYYMIHLNADYVRGDTLDPKQLFVVTEYFYNNRRHHGKLLKEAIRASMTDVSNEIRAMDEALKQPMKEAVRTPKCAGRQKCRYYETCFPNESRIPDNSILTLSGSQHRYAMNSEGKTELKDADAKRIEGNSIQYAQIRADQNGGLFADRMALNAWLGSIVYPLTFLDFEWECFAIPPYKGMRPYDVLLFEYSIHILRQDGTMDHKVFLSTHDDRRELAESLLKDIPESGTILAYNADGAEMIRIRELAELLPEYSERLLGLNSRMKDLQLPFANGIVYDVRMRGSWSLKTIMNMLEENSYQELDIRHGMEAVFEWRHLDREEAGIDRQRIIEDLKAYCSMDSYATAAVFQWLKQLAQSQEER